MQLTAPVFVLIGLSSLAIACTDPVDAPSSGSGALGAGNAETEAPKSSETDRKAADEDTSSSASSSSASSTKAAPPAECAAAAAADKARVLGTFTADPSFHLDTARGVEAEIVTDKGEASPSLWLRFPLPAHIDHAKQQRDDVVTRYHLFVAAGGPAFDFAAGKSGSVSFVDDSSFNSCTPTTAWGTDSPTYGPTPTAKVTISARTDKEIRGTVIVENNGTATSLTFEAPLAAEPAPTKLCCLDE